MRSPKSLTPVSRCMNPRTRHAWRLSRADGTTGPSSLSSTPTAGRPRFRRCRPAVQYLVVRSTGTSTQGCDGSLNEASGGTMKVIDFDGTILDATFSVQPPEQGVASVVFESSGGHEGG